MDMVIKPSHLAGSIHAPTSKSDAHRALIAAALCEDKTDIHFRGSSQDIEATIRTLGALGASFEREEWGVRVTPIPMQSDAKGEAPLLDCGESGSTLRFLLPVAAAVRDDSRFCAQGGLVRRPIGPLLWAMGENGCRASAQTLPLSLEGRLHSGIYTLPGDVSSQYISGLLFALPLVFGDSRIVLSSPLESAGYVEMTLDMLSRFGIRIEREKNAFLVFGGQRYRSPGKVEVEGDWSGAAFFLAAGALGGPITVAGLRQDSLQRDKEILSLLGRFGAEVSCKEDLVTVSKGRLRGIEIDLRDVPDLAPALSVVAALCSGKTELTHAARLRMKESDRIATIAAMLGSFGIDTQEKPDALTIPGAVPTGGEMDSAGDHRIAMAGAILAAFGSGETMIHDAMAVEKSYPAFYDDYRTLGGVADEKRA